MNVFLKNAQIALFAFLIILSFNTSAKDYWHSENIAKSENYIFGYGSLVNTESRLSSLKSNKSVVAARISSEFGYRRSWNYRGPGFTALGLIESSTPTTINGVIYAVDDSNIEVLDDREKNYRRVEVPWSLVESADWMSLPASGKLWIYVPIDTYEPNDHYPLLQSYIDICVSGFMEYGVDFAIEFLETTDGWSQHWMNDRILARRPWVHFTQYKEVDELLMKYPEGNNTFARRLFVSQWGLIE